ncbi:MAG TPA: ABC transporter permease, partial [Myxococcus sp.]|nr:ABC transporter permease [Myxococcus sp.]
MGKRSIREQLRGLIWRAPVAEEVDAELQFHLEMVTRELVEGGMTPEAARAEALRRFGNLEAVRQECHTLGSAERRERRWANWLAELGQDAVYALRQLRGAPGFALTAVLALALGIGATTAIFSAVRGVVLRPFPWAEPDRVMLVSESYRGQRTSMSAGNFVDLKASASRFEQLAAQDFDSFSLQEGDSPERVLAGRVTPGFFDVFGVRPLLGRTFLAAEDVEEAEVVLGHALWRGSFGADPGIVGRSIRLDGASYTVVGVMPPGFDPTLSAEQLWVPLVFTPAQRAGHDNRTLSAVGRLARDATPAQAGAQLAGIMRELEARYPAANTGRSARVEPLGEVLVSDWSRQLLVTLG